MGNAYTQINKCIKKYKVICRFSNAYNVINKFLMIFCMQKLWGGNFKSKTLPLLNAYYNQNY